MARFFRISAVAMLAVPWVASGQTPSRALNHGAPWQVQIYSNFDGYSEEERAQAPLWALAHRCGGILIEAQWVLTAAHCISQDQVDRGWRVRLGATDIGSGAGATYRIDRLVRHAGYDPQRHWNDIAVIHFVADDKTDTSRAGRVQPIRLNGSRDDDRGVAPREEVTATGWGDTAAGGDKSSVLMQVDLKTVNCKSVTAYKDRTTGSMICASSPSGDSCQGDSGGPLVRTWGEPVLVGIISWGEGCADPNRPGVYVRVDRQHYFDWIRRAMAADPSVNSLD